MGNRDAGGRTPNEDSSNPEVLLPYAPQRAAITLLWSDSHQLEPRATKTEPPFGQATFWISTVVSTSSCSRAQALYSSACVPSAGH